MNEVESKLRPGYTVSTMTDDKSQETQQELFQEFSSTPKHSERFPTLAKAQKPILISTTIEQILMVSIVLILTLCGVFFLGLLRGKSLRPSAVPVVAAIRRVQPTKVSVVPVQKPSIPTGVSIPAVQKPYTIQLVTHRKKEYAETEANAVQKLGITSFIIPSGEYFQVCAGQYASKEEAKKDLAFFQSKYKDCFLRRRA